MIDHEKWFRESVRIAQRASCQRRKCGSVIVKNDVIIGSGYNSPPLDDEAHRRCDVPVDKLAKYPTDKTCCVHAEQRAMFDALRRHPEEIIGASLYFASINEQGEMLYSGYPYCTQCSKLALDLGLSYFGLWHEDGIKMYDTTHYHELSWESAKKRPHDMS